MRHWTEREETPQERGRRKEKETAKELGGRLTPNSGATPGFGGDFFLGDWLVEHKTSTDNSFRVSVDMMNKIDKEACKQMKKPMLIVELKGKLYCVIDRDYLEGRK